MHKTSSIKLVKPFLLVGLTLVLNAPYQIGYTQDQAEPIQALKEEGHAKVQAATREAQVIVDDAVDNAKNAVTSVLNDGEAQLSETTQNVKEAVEGVQHRVTEHLDQVKQAQDEVIQVVDETRAVIAEERKALQEELSSLRAQLEEAKQSATRSFNAGAESLRWNLDLSPNIDGSLAFQLGGEYQYLNRFLIGLSYDQIQRIQRDECDQLSTRSCKAYAEITDRQFTLRGFGYELPFGQNFQITFNLNGILLLQQREGTSVDVILDRYISSRGDFSSLQINTQLELDWRITQYSYMHLEGSISPYHYSAEREEGYDSGLVAQMSQSVGRIGNENNLVYTGQLGNYTNYFYNDSSYYDGSVSLYTKDLIGESDLDLSVTARYLSYGAQATRAVIYNGEPQEINAVQDFEKIDLFTQLAFELSFLGFTPSNPMLGLTHTWSSFDGVNTKTTSHSFGFLVSFATPPQFAQSRAEEQDIK